MTITVNVRNHVIIGKFSCSGLTHFIRLEATLVTTSLPPSNRRGIRLAKRYTFTPSFTWSSTRKKNRDADAKARQARVRVHNTTTKYIRIWSGKQAGGEHAQQGRKPLSTQISHRFGDSKETTGLGSPTLQRERERKRERDERSERKHGRGMSKLCRLLRRKDNTQRLHRKHIVLKEVKAKQCHRTTTEQGTSTSHLPLPLRATLLLPR